MGHSSAILWWLRIVAVFVIATLVLGGVTRLTDSGLSITEWAPLLGVIPPLDEKAWHAAFRAYQAIPEYALVNEGMSLAQFRFIYWWEWSHRLVARTIGLVFFVPLVWFWVRGRLPGWFKPWAVTLLGLGALQGAVGWWMVTSGLADRVDVSHYRLAVHLTLACVILMVTVWLSVRVRGGAGSLLAPAAVRRSAVVVPFAILVQVALGALVAGLDAGLASNTWPLMGAKLVPDGLWTLRPAWLNAFENPLAVQFNHRVAAYLLLIVVSWHAVGAAWAGRGAREAFVILALTILQAAFGVALVVLEVPLALAALHQLTAAVLLWVATAHATRFAPLARARLAVRAA